MRPRCTRLCCVVIYVALARADLTCNSDQCPSSAPQTTGGALLQTGASLLVDGAKGGGASARRTSTLHHDQGWNDHNVSNAYSIQHLTTHTPRLILKLMLLAACFLISGTLWWCTRNTELRDAFNTTMDEDTVFEGNEADVRHQASLTSRKHAEVLSYLHIDKNGGLDRIHIFSGDKTAGRCLDSVLLIGGFVVNVVVITLIGATIIEGYFDYCNGMPVEEIPILRQLGKKFPHGSELALRLAIRLTALVAVFEFFAGNFMVAHVMRELCTFNFAPSKFEQWNALREMAWESIPVGASISGLKVLKYVHPSLMGTMLASQLAEPMFGHSIPSIAFEVLWFMVSRVCAFFIGALALASKLLLIWAYAEQAYSFNIIQKLVALMFLCSFTFQFLLIVALDSSYKGRILDIFFGGADGILSNFERRHKRIYTVRVVREIYRELSGFERWILLLTFSFEDFQRLLLYEEEEKKSIWRDRVLHAATFVGEPAAPSGGSPDGDRSRGRKGDGGEAGAHARFHISRSRSASTALGDPSSSMGAGGPRA